MSNNMARWYQILALLTVGSAISITAQAGPEIPSKDDRSKADTELKSKESEFKNRTTAVDDATKLRMNLAKSVEALEKTYTPLAKEADEMTALAKKRMDEAKASRDDKLLKQATELKEQAEAMQIEIQKMQVTLETLQELKKKADEKHATDQKEVNRLKLEVQKALLTYFRTADPSMIAQRYGVPLDINFSFNATEFMKVTNGADPKNWLSRYGLVAEHTWDDRYAYWDMDGYHTITLKSISQHEQVTTRDMYDTATKLIESKIPGMKAPVGRFGLTRNWGHYKNDADPYKGVFGHPVDAFRPSVISNSTGAWSPLHEWENFRDLMDTHTKGEDAVTLKAANGTITYGLPPMGKPILVNASGNSGYGFIPDTTNIQNFVPNRLNIGTVTVPVNPKTGKRDDTAPHEVESYSTSNAGVHALIQRPRYNKDGSEIVFQYLNPKFESILEENLWRLAGKPGIPTPEQLTDEKEYPPELVKAIAHDKAQFIKVILRNEGVDAKGQTKDLRGTSFACPTAAGVVMAARLYYPDASEAEIMDAFCSSCVPITHRRDVDALGRPADLKDDVPYLLDKKSGYCYSPMVGFGEFIIRDDATKENPDSWLKMLARLEAMKQARSKLPNATVKVGSGPEERTVALNGQPPACTLEMDKFTEIVTAEDKKRIEGHDKTVAEAFAVVDQAYGTSVMKDAAMQKHLKNHEYKEALALLKKGISASPAALLDVAFPPLSLPGALSLPAAAIAKAELLKKAEDAVTEAERMKQHTYSFDVLEGQDMCLTSASLRLHFKDMSKTDDFVILESPDGTRIPIIMGSASDYRGTPTGHAVASTPGVMRKSSAGTWKLYTRQELDTTGTLLILHGTERNTGLGIVDVRESVLNPVELADAKSRTDVPAKNVITIPDPHKHLRVMNGLEPGTKSQKVIKAAEVSPRTRREFQEYMEDLIEHSKTIEVLEKSGKLPAPDKRSIEKISLNEAARPDPALGVAIASMASQLSDVLSDTMAPSVDTPLRDSWGYLAAAMVNKGEAAETDMHEASRSKRGVRIPEGAGYMELLNKRKGDVPPWWHDNQVAQVQASRKTLGVGGRRA